MSKSTGPILIELEPDTPAAKPATAPIVPDLEGPPQGKAMQSLAAVASRKPSRLARFFWQALLALISFAASIAAYDFVMGLLARSPILGGIAVALMGLFVLALLLVAGKEWLAIGRLKKIDTYRADAEAALNNADLKAAKTISNRVVALYASRPELVSARSELAARRDEAFDADAVIGMTERSLLEPLDEAASREVEAAARQVATVTAIVPLALADLAAALTSNLRMIRRIAEIYGGRSGTLGSWRLTRAVFSHLVATGAVAVGDDLIGSIAGGGVLSKLSRRFGEGMISPSVTGIVKRSLVGLIPGK